jgi:histidine ammonia-lyase
MVAKSEKVIINGNELTVEQVYAVASLNAPVAIDPLALEKVKKGRKIVNDITKSNREVYGITTGTGANKDVRIPQDLVTEFQNRILVSHCVGIKPYYPEDIVRAIMLCRANAMAKGASGVQPQIVEMFVDMLNAGIHPVTPMRGSVGTSDLGPMAELSLPIIGLGEVFYKGEKMPSKKALKLAGLTPVKLAPKDGITLCNNNGITMGHGTMVIKLCEQLLDTADLSYALLLEGYRGNVSPLHPGVSKVRPHIGQEFVANKIDKLILPSKKKSNINLITCAKIIASRAHINS